MTYPYDAACRDEDPEIFFPLGETEMFVTEATKAAERQAQAVCARCPVARACLDHALTSGEEWGVWGGTTSRERRAMRARKVHEWPVVWLIQHIIGHCYEEVA